MFMSKLSRPRAFRGGAVLALAVFFSASLFAQDAPVDDPWDDAHFDFGIADELVITATRTLEPLAVVPAQVTVITAEEIAASGATSLPEVLARVPGVRFRGALAGAGSEAISMRGFGENSHGRVLILVDGNRINTPDMAVANWRAISLADIERIEILDGSASVQYGNHAVGGVINIITNRSGERRTVLGVFGGNFFTHGLSFSHFSPAPWGNFSLSAEHSGARGYRERQESRATNIAGRATLFLADNLNLSLSASFSDLWFQLPGPLNRAEFENDPRNARLSLHDENVERHVGGGIGLQWLPAENMEVNLPIFYLGRFVRSELRDGGWASFTDRTVHSLEARPQGSVTFDVAGMPLRILGGLDVQFGRLDSDSFNERNFTDWDNSIDISQWTIGPYLTARFSPLPNLALSAGARFDTSIISAQYEGAPQYWGSFWYYPEDIDETLRFNAFVYEVGVAFNPMRDLRLYARYATLFRYPFLDELVSWGTFNPDLEPERGFNVEVGANYRFGRMLDISANFFFMVLEDEIFYDPVTFLNSNLDGRTRRLGANVGLNVMPVDFLSLSLSYSFVNAVITAGDYRDNRVPLVPAHTLNWSLTARLPFGLYFGPNFEFASSSYFANDFANQWDRLDSWFILGAQARYAMTMEGRELAFQVTARNLLNRSFVTMGVVNILNGNVSLYPENGRSVTFSLQYRF